MKTRNRENNVVGDVVYVLCRIGESFDSYFANADDEKVKYSLNPPTVIQWMKQNFTEDSELVVCLKVF